VSLSHMRIAEWQFLANNSNQHMHTFVYTTVTCRADRADPPRRT